MKSTLYANRNMSKVELGMTKKEVVSIMGKEFKTIGANRVPEGDIEMIGYENAEGEVYVLRFLNGNLVNYELTHPHRHPENGYHRYHENE